MSRVRFKGGAWTNSEDEVLRASLTVYGLQNWERVASMLVRKTATQCRERWENYLDPRLHIREEWTAEEEEQLVQLQSLFANQWKLIARELSRRSGMNRPAWLCEEHYHSLLDALEYARQQKDDNNNKRNDALSLEDFLEERRRHRAYHQGHETKAARHDAVNSDVFEKEMVEFAVSRLANQDGKKGLRKERKKQLEHTSFLAKLQSNREAIESGTLSAKAKKRMERAMLEDQAGPSNTRLHDGTVEEDDDESEVNEEESRSSKHKKSFRPIDLGADKQEAGIEAKHRVLVKDLKRDKAHLAQGATASEGVNVELLRLTASGGVSAAVGNRLEGKKDKLSIANSASTAPSGSIGSADLDQLFASLPDAITTKKESDVRAPSNPLDDLFRAIPPPVLSSTRPKEGDVALFNDDDHEEDEDSDTSIIISHAPSTQTPSRTVDFSPVEWEACLRRAKKRVLVEAERMFLGPQRVRHRMSPSNRKSQATTVNREDENEYVEVEEKGEDDESTSRIVRALVEQQLPAVAQSLLDEKGISLEALRKKVRRDTEYGSNPYDNISEDEKKKREKKEDLASKLATSVAEVQQGEGAEFWKDVGATEATVQLDELVHHQREQAETATAKDVEAQKRLERIVRICFAGRGQDMRRGGDIIRRACIYWGAQLQDAERQLTFYTAIREAEQKEIQKRLNDAASRLTDIEQRERLLQEQYRSMRLMLRWVVKEVESPYGSVATMHWAVDDGNDDSNDDTIMKDADTGHALLEQQLESSEDQLGAVLWNSNTVALQYLHDHVLCDKKRCYHVVELGAGVGCLGIALAMAGAHVVITDLKELVPLMQKNIELNADRIQSRSNGQGTCKALALRWGPVPKPKKQQKENTPQLAERRKDTSPYEMPSPPFLALQEELGHIDVVVLCDALYGNPKHWPQLLYTLSEILLTNPTCEIMNFCEQRVDDVEGDFLKLLQEENMKTLSSDASEEDEDEVKKKKKEKSLEDALTRMRGAYEWWTSTEVVGEGKSDLNMTVRATRIRWVRRGRKRNVTSSSSLSPPMRGNDDVEDCEESPQRKRRRAES